MNKARRRLRRRPAVTGRHRAGAAEEFLRGPLTPRASRIVTYGVLVVLKSVILTWFAVLSVRLLDQIYPHAEPRAVVGTGAMAAALLLISGELEAGRQHLAVSEGNRWTERLRARLFGSVAMAWPLGGEEPDAVDGKALDPVDAGGRHVDRLRSLATPEVPDMVDHFGGFCAVVVAMVLLDVQLAVLASAIAAGVVAVQLIQGQTNYPLEARQSEQADLVRISLTPEGRQLSRVCGTSASSVATFAMLSRTVSELQTATTRGAQRRSTRVATVLGLAGIGTYVAAGVHDFHASPGTVAMFAALQWRLSFPAVALIGGLISVRREIKEAKRLQALLALPPMSSGSVKLPPGPLALELDGVSCLNRGLVELRLGIRAGERIALTGVSGSGKSTVLALLARTLRPDAGVVRIGGCDVEELDEASLRSAVAFAPQPPTIFEKASVWWNIVFGRTSWTTEDLALATWVAAVRSPLGDTARERSTGERQRIAVARALLLLRRARVLLLDEPTANLDPQTERELHARLELVTRGLTVVLAVNGTPPSGYRVVRMEDLRPAG